MARTIQHTDGIYRIIYTAGKRFTLKRNERSYDNTGVSRRTWQTVATIDARHQAALRYILVGYLGEETGGDLCRAAVAKARTLHDRLAG